MDENNDDFALSPEELELVVGWAVGAGTTLNLILNGEAEMEDKEKLERWTEIIQYILANVPDGLIQPILTSSQRIHEAAVAEQEIIENFQKELDGL